MNTDKLKTKDIITVVLMSLINIVIFSIGSLFYLMPVTILLMPVFYSLLQGIVFYMIGVKVQKKGAIFLYCVIQGVIGFNIPYIAMFLLAGIIGEILLSKQGYGNPKALGISYVIMQVLASFGSTIYPYGIVLDATLDNMGNSAGDLGVNVRAAGEMIGSWGMAVLILAILVSAIAGAYAGYRVMKKHFDTM